MQERQPKLQDTVKCNTESIHHFCQRSLSFYKIINPIRLRFNKAEHIQFGEIRKGICE